MRIYFDTSAFVKRYCEEEGSEIVNEIFESNEIITSYWTLAEATTAIDEFIEAIIEMMIIEMILVHHISADDALQLFSCIISFSPIFLVSDRSLIEAAKREGLKVFDIENSEERERLRRLLVGEDDGN